EDIFKKDDKTIPPEEALGIMGNAEPQTGANGTASFPSGNNDNADAENLLDEISLEDGSSDETEKTSEKSLNDISLQTGVESAIPPEQPIGEADPEDAEKPLESELGDTGDGSHPVGEAEKESDGKSGEGSKEKVSESDSPDRLEYFEEAESQEDKTNPDLDDAKTFFTDEENESAEKTNVNETLMLQTRMASVEEINYIKDQVRKKQQHRLFFRVSIFTAIAFALFCIWHLRAPQQEKELSWPTDKSGEKCVSTATPFERGWKKGGFDVYYPDCGKRTIVSGDSTSVCEIRSFIGKRKDVPLRIIITKQADRQGLEESRKQSFARLLTGKLQSKNEQFTFDRGGSEIFLGRNNGILCSCIYYQKDQNSRSFFGRLYYFKYGAVSYCLTAEVPMEDKNRARNLLDENTFFDVSDKFVALHWEGTNDFIRGNLLVRIDEIEDDIRRKSPFQIASLENGLRGVLIQATLDKNLKIQERAVELLGKLRKNEDELYREKMGQWLLALATKNEMLKQKVRNDSEGIFSMETDRRRSLILKDAWECEK
ncbi:hypothetical protein IKP13_00215, partial [bacterium]|nr:hypothetical protein [bacterium]